MREIKFRGRSVFPVPELDERGIKHKNGWVYGAYLQGYILSGIADVSEEGIAPEQWCKVDPVTVGMSTGHKMPNGQELYGGDVLEYDYRRKRARSVVDWSNAKSGFRLIHKIYAGIDSFCEVMMSNRNTKLIGNVHDNPKLLEEYCIHPILETMNEDEQEKPIVFSDEEVQAILDGRKTQTRLVITPQTPGVGVVLAPGKAIVPPYRPGDMLYNTARLFLRVTDVWAERLQDITEKDAIAEGCGHECDCNLIMCETCMNTGWAYHPIQAFFETWDSLNKNNRCNTNPWVWVVEFERAEKPEVE